MKIFFLPHFLFGFSYTFLLFNKIAFGISLLLGIISLFVLHFKTVKLKFKFNDLKINFFFYLTIFFFLISCYFSINPERSVLVIIYFIFFIIISLNLFFLLIKNNESYKKILFFFFFSTLINITYIFVYNLYQSGILLGDFQNQEVRRFKGVLNIISILVFMLIYFRQTKFFLVGIFF